MDVDFDCVTAATKTYSASMLKRFFESMKGVERK